MKVGIVGSGLVGSTAAFALVMQGVGRELVLVDKNAARAEAEADDIRHAVPFAHPLEIRSGSFKELAGCPVVLLCAVSDSSQARPVFNCCTATLRSFARRFHKSLPTRRKRSLSSLRTPSM